MNDLLRHQLAASLRAAPRPTASVDRFDRQSVTLKDNAIKRLNEINRILLPDSPHGGVSAESVGRARARIVELIAVIAAAP